MAIEELSVIENLPTLWTWEPLPVGVLRAALLMLLLVASVDECLATVVLTWLS